MPNLGGINLMFCFFRTEACVEWLNSGFLPKDLFFFVRYILHFYSVIATCYSAKDDLFSLGSQEIIPLKLFSTYLCFYLYQKSFLLCLFLLKLKEHRKLSKNQE